MISFQFHCVFQRVALCIAVNMCKKLPADAAEFVTNAVPLLSQLLQEHDAKVRPYDLYSGLISATTKVSRGCVSNAN